MKNFFRLIFWLFSIFSFLKILRHYSVTVSKKKENLLKEREILIGEVETMRQRIKNMSIYTEELEKRSTESEQRMTEMQETIGMQLNEISREKKIREKAETDMQQLQEEIIIKKNELEVKYFQKIIRN